MSVKHEGQSPSRLWYAWQHAKAYIHCLKDKHTEKDAKKMARNGGYAAGSLAAASLTANFLFFIPLAPTLAGLAGLAAASYFGWKSWQKMTLLKNSSTVYSYVRKQEDKWIQKKSGPSLMARTAAFGKRLFGRAALPFATAGKWSGYGAALLGLTATGLTLLQTTGAAQVPFWAGITAGAVKTGALLGLSATAALTGAVALAVAAIPVGFGVGKLCKSLSTSLKKDFIAHQATGARPTLKSRLEKPAANNNSAPAVKAAPDAGKSFDAATAPRQGEALSEERKRAAAARAEARARNRRTPKSQF